MTTARPSFAAIDESGAWTRVVAGANSARWPAFLSFYAMAHGVWFALYALLGKGFAYAGIPLLAGMPPLYVGEVLLVFAAVVFFCSRRVFPLLRTPIGLLMFAFMSWQLACTIPYLRVHGVDTLRDSVLWAYAVFAWVAAALVLRMPGLLRAVLKQFTHFARWFLFFAPAAWLATTYLRDSLPHWPGTSVSIPLVKGNEYCVHLAGIMALSLQGAGLRAWWWIGLVVVDAILAMTVRGGLVAFIVAVCCAMLLRPKLRRFIVICLICLLLIAGMAVFDLRYDMPVVGRELSVDQLVDSISSIIGNSENTNLEATKQWRLNWWRDIRGYTLDGPYFWEGKGYGINLAESDGFQGGSRDEPLRSPHNSHLTFLARSGVPGFVLWLALQAAWAAMMLASYIQARRLNVTEWRCVFAWLLCYWAGFMVAAMFDVFLEGPMAGIPFWTIFGVGWGSITLFRSQLRKNQNASRYAAGPVYA